MSALTLYPILNAFALQVHLSMQESCLEFALDMPSIIRCSEGHAKALMTLQFARTTANSNLCCR